MTAPTHAPSDNTRGILAMNVAMFGFISNDTCVKIAMEALPLGEIMFVRGIVATSILLGFATVARAWGQWRRLIHPLMGLRLVGEIGATLLYLTALAHMPIGNVSAIFQATPLAMTAGAALVFKEPVGWRRWAAIAAGFGGVLIIVRPGMEGFNAYAVLILAAVVCVVVRDLATSRIPAAVPTSLVTGITALIVTLTGAALFPFEATFSAIPDWRPLDLRLLAVLIGAGVFLLVGYVTLIFAMRWGEMSVIAPFRYMLLVWSFVYGITLFGDRPDAATMIGAAIVVGSGLYTVHRERVRRLAAARAAASLPGAG